jgi:hypothetical protein
MKGMKVLTCRASGQRHLRPDVEPEVRRITEHPYRASRVEDMRELYVVQMGSARGRGPRAGGFRCPVVSPTAKADNRMAHGCLPC